MVRAADVDHEEEAKEVAIIAVADTRGIESISLRVHGTRELKGMHQLFTQGPDVNVDSADEKTQIGKKRGTHNDGPFSARTSCTFDNGALVVVCTLEI